MEEVWKDIEGYEGLYQVSNYGRIKSLSRIDARGHKRKEKILKLIHDKDGYLLVNLYKNNKVKIHSVHRVVAQAFIPNPDNLPEVNHKIDNFEHRSDNRVENLEWCTHEYNCNYGTRNEKLSESNKGKNSKKVKCITTNEVFNSIKDAEEKYGVSHQNISKCCKGKYKSAGKHPVTGEKLIWEYV